MPQKTLSKKQAKAALKERESRETRGTSEIRKILERDNLTLTAQRVRIFFEKPDGKLEGGEDEVSLKTLARLMGMPVGTVLFPQVKVHARSNGAVTK